MCKLRHKSLTVDINLRKAALTIAAGSVLSTRFMSWLNLMRGGKHPGGTKGDLAAQLTYLSDYRYLF